MAVVLFAFLIVSPLLIATWSVRTMRRFPGRWRRAATVPLLLVFMALLVAAHGFTEGIHSDWPLIALPILVLAAVLAYTLSELRQAAERRTSIATAPPNER